MIKFDWMEAWDKSMYYDVETSKVWAVITRRYNSSTSTFTYEYYEYNDEFFVSLDKLKKSVENQFLLYGSRINSLKDSV